MKRPIVRIDNPDDPRVAPFREVRERDVAGRHRGFIAEGEVVLNVLARSRLYRVGAVLLAEKRVDGLATLIASFPEETPIYAAPQPVMDAIAGFPIHRGILAFGERPDPIPASSLLAEHAPDAIVLGLFGISNHDNIGGIFRNAAAFGVAAVLIDAACCDPLYRKAIRVSVGGVLTVPFARIAPGEDAVAMLKVRGFETAALSPGGHTVLSDYRPGRPCAVLFGSEGAGLPAEILDRVATISIAMNGRWDSLNVATTSGIVLHHLRATRRDVIQTGASMEPPR
jgi:tRNA G18 (ribose-2'-O)-methylase SpoU